jgi:hypothetical protein
MAGGVSVPLAVSAATRYRDEAGLRAGTGGCR